MNDNDLDGWDDGISKIEKKDGIFYMEAYLTNETIKVQGKNIAELGLAYDKAYQEYMKRFYDLDVPPSFFVE